MTLGEDGVSHFMVPGVEHRMLLSATGTKKAVRVDSYKQVLPHSSKSISSSYHSMKTAQQGVCTGWEGEMGWDLSKDTSSYGTWVRLMCGVVEDYFLRIDPRSTEDADS